MALLLQVAQLGTTCPLWDSQPRDLALKTSLPGAGSVLHGSSPLGRVVWWAMQFLPSSVAPRGQSRAAR